MPVPNFYDIWRDDKLILNIHDHLNPCSILITGAQGMIGNASARALSQTIDEGMFPNAKIYLASRHWAKPSKLSWTDNSRVTLIENHDISSIKDEINLVIHAASPSNITKVKDMNDLKSANLGILEDIYRLNPLRIVYLSSGEVYKGQDLPEGAYSFDFSSDVKRDWYPMAKLEAENSLLEMSREGRTSVSVIRLFHTFGPGMKKNDGRSFADIIWGAAENKEIILSSPGHQVRTFLYLSDAVNMIMSKALGKEDGFEISNLGSTKPVSILQFANYVADITDSVIFHENKVDFLHSPNDSIVPRIENLARSGWKPGVTLSEGISRTIDWVRNSIR